MAKDCLGKEESNATATAKKYGNMKYCLENKMTVNGNREF